MSQRSPGGNTPSLPWVGIAALGAATFGAGAVIAGQASLQGLLHPWYLTRAAGIIAFLLLWASVCAGLLQSTQFLKGASSPLANIDIHTFLSLGALYATTFHVVILLFDRYVKFSLADLLIPFASEYKPVLVGLGGLAFYIALGVSVSTYLRSKLNAKVWRAIHLTSLVAFALALVHGAVLGTDRHAAAVAFLYRFAAISVVALTGYRVYLGVKKRANSAGGR
ncbi:MAG TPA: ferric reductase-like transmembrane domain-containing protein [Symbiobacteriaceae bacterium]|nr:ferric reductase-like transmembrane domain-containing protein [Symbiobacteriaceae bacterium]